MDSELGTIQPVSEIAEILRDYPDCRLHVDATQAMGKIPVCLDGIDTLSFTPHKFYGLNGSGILYKKGPDFGAADPRRAQHDDLPQRDACAQPCGGS